MILIKGPRCHLYFLIPYIFALELMFLFSVYDYSEWILSFGGSRLKSYGLYNKKEKNLRGVGRLFSGKALYPVITRWFLGFQTNFHWLWLLQLNQLSAVVTVSLSRSAVRSQEIVGLLLQQKSNLSAMLFRGEPYDFH